MPAPALTEQTLRDGAWQYQDRLFLPAELISLAPFTTFAAMSLVLFFGGPWQYPHYLSLAIFIDAVNYLLSIAIPLRKPRVINVDSMAGDVPKARWLGNILFVAGEAASGMQFAKPGGLRAGSKLGLTPSDWWIAGIITVLMASYFVRLGYYFYEGILTHVLTKMQIVDTIVAIEKVFPFTRPVRIDMFRYEYGFATFKEFLAQIDIIAMLMIMELGFLVPLLKGYVASGYGPAGLARATRTPANAELPDRPTIRRKLCRQAAAFVILMFGIFSPFALALVSGCGPATPLHAPFDRFHVLPLPPAFIGTLCVALLFLVAFKISLRRNTLRYLKANGLLATAP